MRSVVGRLARLVIPEEADSILGVLPDGLLISDSLGRVTYTNARMAQMSGYSRAELIGMSVDMLVPDRLRTMHERQRERFSTEPRARSMESGLDTRVLRKDGTEIPVQIQLSPLEIRGERGVLALVRDVLESRKSRQRVREHEDVLMLVADRETIAMEVTAGVIHTLFGIGLHLQAAALAVPNATDERARQAMEEAIADIDRAITEVRDHIFRHRSQ